MRMIFLSDVHLKSEEGRNHTCVIRFLDGIRGKVDSLFIVGDFFDFWFSRKGIVYPGFIAVVEKLVEIKKEGADVYLCEGNHDFSLGEYFTDRLEIPVFTDWADIELNSRRFYIAHGDTVDEENRKYLFLRKALRSNVVSKIIQYLPLPVLWQIAKISSHVSKELTMESQHTLARKMELFAVSKFQENFDAVILGHCHLPLLKEFNVDGYKKIFVTLGDWLHHFTYLVYENDQFALRSFAL